VLSKMNTQQNENKPLLLAKNRKDLDLIGDSSSSSAPSSRVSKAVMLGLGLSATAALGTLGTYANHGGSVQNSNKQARLGNSDDSSSDVLTLTIGCSPQDLLKMLPFEPQSWQGTVGVKFVTKTMSPTFEFHKGLDMVQTPNCGVYQLPYQLGHESYFGFYLYEKANPHNHMSDIGAQVKGGALSDSSIRAYGWLNDLHAAKRDAKFEDIGEMKKMAINDAKIADAAAKKIAEKIFHSTTELITERKATAGGDEKVPELGLVEVRTYSNYGGTAKTKVDTIACDDTKKSCTFKTCDSTECKEFTKHDCKQGQPGCKVAADFKNPAVISLKTSEERKFFQSQMSPQELKRAENRDMIEKARAQMTQSVIEVPRRRTLLSKIFDIKNSVVNSIPKMGYGPEHPTRLIQYMASCTVKHGAVTGADDVEYYPRIYDSTNPGHTFVFGSCFHDRDHATCKLPTEVLAPGCPGTTATLASSESAITSSSSSTTAATSTTAAVVDTTHLTNANIQEEVAKCLGEEPLKGDCTGQKFGKMSNWDVSRVTDMSQLFDHPPLKNKQDRYSSFNGDLGKWDVTHVTSMKLMFSRALAFEGKNINQWDTKNVEDMQGMFKHADRFNAMISGWNTAKVKKMNVMFQNAFAFDQDIHKWDVSNCDDFTRMFAGTFDKGFSQDIRSWNIKPEARQVDMFFEAYNFQSKFVCDDADHGPLNSCVSASVSKTASTGMNEDAKKKMAMAKQFEEDADDDRDAADRSSLFERFKHWLS